jgi:hypothetical protein
MDARTFILVQAIIALVYAIGFLLIPGSLSELYGAVATPSALLAFRYFGVALLGIGLIFWFAKDIGDPATRDALLTGAGSANAVGVIVSLWGVIAGIMNPLGWSVVVLYVALAAGCFYFRGHAERVLRFGR